MNATAALGALAQDTRLAIFRQLVTAGPDGLAAGALAAMLKVPAPTLSFHLSQLGQAGLVTSRRQSRSIIYAADFGAMNALIEFLTKDCCGGRPELCFPARPARPVRPRSARPRGKSQPPNRRGKSPSRA